MVSQLRIYTINRGMMDSWLKLFEEKLRPGHEKYGIPIEATWVNGEKTEFIWVRSFDSLDDIPVKEKEYYSKRIRDEYEKNKSIRDKNLIDKQLLKKTDHSLFLDYSNIL